MAFEKGISGNPQGRPTGIKDRRTIFRDLVENHKEELVNKAVQLALSGNEQMLKLLLDRLLPSKPKDDPIDDVGTLNGSLSEQGRKVLTLMAEGQLALSEGIELLHAISLQARLIETDELANRLENLEAIYHDSKKSFR